MKHKFVTDRLLSIQPETEEEALALLGEIALALDLVEKVYEQGRPASAREGLVPAVRVARRAIKDSLHGLMDKAAEVSRAIPYEEDHGDDTRRFLVSAPLLVHISRTARRVRQSIPATDPQRVPLLRIQAELKALLATEAARAKVHQ